MVRLTKTAEHDVKQHGRRHFGRRPTQFAAAHQLGRPAVVGPPVLLADGFTSIERDGRRLAVVGMLLIGLVTLSAVHSLWWALVPILAGWVVWLATETILATFNLKLSLSGGPLVAQIIVLTMPAASHLAIHFRDDRRREADRRVAAATTLRAVWPCRSSGAPITGAIGYGALVTSDVVPIVQFGAILGHLHAGRRLAGDGDLADRDAAAVPARESRFGSAPSRGSSRGDEPADRLGSPPSRCRSSTACSPWSFP